QGGEDLGRQRGDRTVEELQRESVRVARGGQVLLRLARVVLVQVDAGVARRPRDPGRQHVGQRRRDGRTVVVLDEVVAVDRLLQCLAYGELRQRSAVVRRHEVEDQ